jgi:hypothetical protein
VDDALTHTVLNVPGSIADDEVPAVPMFDEADFLVTVHQAMGVVSAALAYELSDAVTLAPARSFVDGLPIETLARRVIQGDLQIWGMVEVATRSGPGAGSPGFDEAGIVTLSWIPNPLRLFFGLGAVLLVLFL